MIAPTMSSKTIIVTGGAGFIGSFLCERLLEKGYQVTAVDNFLTGSPSNLAHLQDREGFRLVELDVTGDWGPLEDLYPEGQEPGGQKSVHGVIHAASPASPVDFESLAVEILKVNSLGTQKALEFSQRRAGRFVFTSTSEVYGDPLEHPQKETYFGHVNSIGPRACYDESKRFGEAWISSWVRRYPDARAGMVRIFNTYGPRMRPGDGRVVPEFCMRALNGDPLFLHDGGQQTRSYCYVTDLVEGIVRYYESDLKEPVNLGNPVEMTVEAFAQSILKAYPESLSKMESVPGRPEDPKRRRPDISKAKEKLNWEPQVKLEDGVRQTLVYFRGKIQS